VLPFRNIDENNASTLRLTAPRHARQFYQRKRAAAQHDSRVPLRLNASLARNGAAMG